MDYWSVSDCSGSPSYSPLLVRLRGLDTKNASPASASESDDSGFGRCFEDEAPLECCPPDLVECSECRLDVGVRRLPASVCRLDETEAEERWLLVRWMDRVEPAKCLTGEQQASRFLQRTG